MGGTSNGDELKIVRQPAVGTQRVGGILREMPWDLRGSLAGPVWPQLLLPEALPAGL